MRSRFVLSEGKWGLPVVYPIIDSGHKRGPSQNLKINEYTPQGFNGSFTVYFGFKGRNVFPLFIVKLPLYPLEIN